MERDHKQFWQWRAKIYARFMESSDGRYDEISGRTAPYLSYGMMERGEICKYIDDHGFTIKEQAVIGSWFTPLCCLIASAEHRRVHNVYSLK